MSQIGCELLHHDGILGVLTEYGVPDGPSRLTFHRFMLDSSFNSTVMPEGAFFVKSPNSYSVSCL